MIAGQGGLEEAVQMLDGQSKSPLKQVEALQCFEKSLNAMYMHDYEKCSASFQKASPSGPSQFPATDKSHSV